MKTLGYVAFIGLFLVEIAICASHPFNLLKMEAWQILMIGIAAYRGARALSYNGVFAWLRAPLTVIVRDSSGAGDSVESNPKLSGFWYAVGDCLACPICTGTHVASMLLTLIALFDLFGLFLLYALAGAGVAELLHWHSEREEWQGRYAREQSGTEWMQKNRRE